MSLANVHWILGMDTCDSVCRLSKTNISDFTHAPTIDSTCNTTDDTKLNQEINNNMRNHQFYTVHEGGKITELSENPSCVKLSERIYSLGSQIRMIRIELVSRCCMVWCNKWAN